VDELGGLCSTNGDKRKHNMVFVEISETERLLENLGVDKRIILKWVLNRKTKWLRPVHEFLKY
jgi:hypothetical protein